MWPKQGTCGNLFVKPFIVIMQALGAHTKHNIESALHRSRQLVFYMLWILPKAAHCVHTPLFQETIQRHLQIHAAQQEEKNFILKEP
jgi:hypothetical protein